MKLQGLLPQGISSSQFTLTSFAPTLGSTLGGNQVNLVGSGFSQTCQVSFGKATATVLSSTPNVLTVVIPPNLAGNSPVSVTFPNGSTATATTPFNYVAPLASPPTNLAISPNSDNISGNNPITITGNGFLTPVQVTFGALNATLVAQSSTVITVLDPPETAGTVSVLVTNADGQQAVVNQAFTYNNLASQNIPVLNLVNPNSGLTTGGTTTLVGNNFQSGVSVTFGGVAATITNFSAQALTVQTPPHTEGSVTVDVINMGGYHANPSGTFTYVPPAVNPAPPPVVSSLSPSSGSAAGGTHFTLSGTGFLNPTVTFGGLNANLSSTTASTLSGTTPAQASGVVAVVVTNGDNQQASNQPSFTYVAPPPNLISITPSTGPMTGGNLVTLAGSNFGVGAKVSFAGISANVQTQTSTSIQVTAPQDSGPLLAQVTVTNLDNQISSQNITYTYVPPPAITSAQPSTGLVTGGNTVTLTGSGFQTGATVKFGNNSATVTSVTATSLVVQAPAAIQASPVHIIVTNPDAQSSQPFSYTYTNLPLTLATISPTTGTSDGGTMVTVNGTGFVTGTVVLLGLTQVATQFVSTTQLTFTSHPAPLMPHWQFDYLIPMALTRPHRMVHSPIRKVIYR